MTAMEGPIHETRHAVRSAPASTSTKTLDAHSSRTMSCSVSLTGKQTGITLCQVILCPRGLKKAKTKTKTKTKKKRNRTKAKRTNPKRMAKTMTKTLQLEMAKR